MTKTRYEINKKSNEAFRKKLDRIEIFDREGFKEIVKAAAAAAGQSVNAYIVQAINERMEREKSAD